jgi:hypothetical protein
MRWAHVFVFGAVAAAAATLGPGCELITTIPTGQGPGNGSDVGRGPGIGGDDDSAGRPRAGRTDPPPGAGSGAGPGAGSGGGDADDSAGPLGGEQRVWAWFNPGTTSSDLKRQRGIALDKGYGALKRGGWAAWIEARLTTLGSPPVILRAPFGTSAWVGRDGESTSAFRYEDAIDVQRDPTWSWIASDRMFVQPWARYPAPVMFHIGTADDRVLTDAELRLGIHPFVEVKRARDRIGNTAPVYVCLDHSMYFDDEERGGRSNMSRREALQTSMVTELLEAAGIDVLTEAVPDESWDSAAYWVKRGVAFRPHLAQPRERNTPVPLDRFEGLVLAWLLPPDWRDWQDRPMPERHARIVEATRTYGNVAVPPYIAGNDRATWQSLELMVAESARRSGADR